MSFITPVSGNVRSVNILMLYSEKKMYRKGYYIGIRTQTNKQINSERDKERLKTKLFKIV